MQRSQGFSCVSGYRDLCGCRTMGTRRCLLVAVFLLLQNDLAHAVAPLLCSSTVCTINPTQNTITLEKPYCFYTASTTTVYLYVVQDSAVNKTISSTNTYYTTNAGSTAPYVATTFANPNCAVNPTIADVNQYVYRVGSRDNCIVTSPYCDGALAANTAYRFQYAFYNAANTSVFQSDWSAPVTTKQGKTASLIDTWPGRRSGGMIVITSILSVLTFFVLAAFVAAVITYMMTPRSEPEPTMHTTQTSHNVPQKSEGGASNIPGSERYAATPQV